MSYKQGVADAISELKDRTGSSMIAIKKVMQAKLPQDKKWQNAIFLQALKAGVASGDFVQLKNSYKLSADFKKKLADAAKPKKTTPTTKEVASKKAVSTKKKAASKKKSTITKKKTLASKKKDTITKNMTVASKKKVAKKKISVKAKKATPKKKATATKKTSGKKKVAAAQ